MEDFMTSWKAPSKRCVAPVVLSRQHAIDQLAQIKDDANLRERFDVLVERALRHVDASIENFHEDRQEFSDYKTNPAVLAMFAYASKLNTPESLCDMVKCCKLFMTMETISGTILEQTVPLLCGYEDITNNQYEDTSVTDSRLVEPNRLKVIIHKSGPACINKDMAKTIGEDTARNVTAWAALHDVDKVEVTVGHWYGTPLKLTNFVWTALRTMMRGVGEDDVIVSPDGRMDCEFVRDGVTVKAAVRLGLDLYRYMGDERMAYLVAAAFCKAFVKRSDRLPENDGAHVDPIPGLAALCQLPHGAKGHGILETHQLPFYMLYCSHLADQIID